MILLTRFDDGAQHFQDVGDGILVIDKDTCKEKFEATLEKWFGKDLPKHKEDTHCFITWADGSQQVPLYKGFDYTLLNNTGGVIRELTFH